MKRIIIVMATLLSFIVLATFFATSVAIAQTFTVNYTKAKDIVPKSFTVKRGENVRLEINATDTGTGCMSSIMVPGLWNKPEPLVKGKKIVMKFTPQHSGAYKITCAMGVPRGVINVL